MLVALAGLPGTGTTAIAGHLAIRLPGIVLDKDRLRACLFPPEDVRYTVEQDDFVMDVAYQVADHLFHSDRDRYILIDGRTFSKHYQVADLLRWAERIGVPVKVIECICADAVAEERLGRDTARPCHPAANRTVDLYHSLKAQADPLRVPRLVIDTGECDLANCVERALAYVRGAG
jgi:predicted kinase